MPLSLFLLAPLLAQAGPDVSPGAGGALPQAPLEIRRPRPPGEPAQGDRLGQCLATAARDPFAALDSVEQWAEDARGLARSEVGECEGVALVAIERWGQAHSAFVRARDAAPANELARRARLGAMAGNAALADGDPVRSDALFTVAHSDATNAAAAVLAGDIAVDWSRALVALGRIDEAGERLAAARSASPQNALGWLLSATLSRREERLGEAQAQIEEAARLALPNSDIGPAIGLEAGVIAILSDREAAARRSWQSVILVAPESAEAATAQAYLDQLGPEPPTPTP